MSDDLISRQAAIDAVKGRFSMPVDNLIVEVIGELPSAQPTTDAVEVVHGEWIPFQRPNGGYYTGCSICSFPMPTDSMCDFMDETDNRFCYNCGAKMDGEVNA